MLPFRLVFVCTPGDTAEIAACRATGHEVLVTPWEGGRGDYARKINLAFAEQSEEPWIFQAADDLRFEPGWDVAAVALAEATGAGVIGTNDLGNPRVTSGQASTHSLIRRLYLEEFGGEHGVLGTVMHEGYWHNFCDEELVDLAGSRGRFRFARRSIVEHLHPHWKKAASDSTYVLGLLHFREDQVLYGRRRRLWSRQPSARRGIYRA